MGGGVGDAALNYFKKFGSSIPDMGSLDSVSLNVGLILT
jgi:hypothetical protein